MAAQSATQKVIDLEEDLRTPSNGDPKYWPAENDTTKEATNERKKVFLDGLARAHMKKHPEDGQVIFIKFPSGYKLFTVDRKKKTEEKSDDDYLYGSPLGRWRSAVQFYVHLEGLVIGMGGLCDCVQCSDRHSSSDE